MTDRPADARIEAISNLLWEAAKAHHAAFAQEDGANAEWPEWYATYIHPRLVDLAGRSLTRSEVVFMLVLADKQYRAEDRTERWTDYYARVFLDQEF